MGGEGMTNIEKRQSITQQEVAEFLQDWLAGKTIMCLVCKGPVSAHIDMQMNKTHVELRRICDCGDQVSIVED